MEEEKGKFVWDKAKEILKRSNVHVVIFVQGQIPKRSCDVRKDEGGKESPHANAKEKIPPLDEGSLRYVRPTVYVLNLESCTSFQFSSHQTQRG